MYFEYSLDRLGFYFRSGERCSRILAPSFFALARALRFGFKPSTMATEDSSAATVTAFFCSGVSPSHAFGHEQDFGNR